MKKRLLSIVLLALMLMHLLPAAFAAEKTGDDLYVRQTTDKATYGSEEYIITTLSVTNTNNSAQVLNLRLKNYTPDGYYVVSGYSSEKRVNSLRAGETVTLSTRLAHTNAPATGDDSAGSLLLYAGMALASAAVFIWLVGSKKLRRYISMFLVCCMLVGFIPFVGNEAAFAEENQTKEISLSTTVKVGQNNRTVYSSVFYTVPVAVIPTAVKGLTYNGKEQIGVLPGEGYTLTGNKATAAGGTQRNSNP